MGFLSYELVIILYNITVSVIQFLDFMAWISFSHFFPLFIATKNIWMGITPKTFLSFSFVSSKGEASKEFEKFSKLEKEKIYYCLSFLFKRLSGNIIYSLSFFV